MSSFFSPDKARLFDVVLDLRESGEQRSVEACVHYRGIISNHNWRRAVVTPAAVAAEHKRLKQHWR